MDMLKYFTAKTGVYEIKRILYELTRKETGQKINNMCVCVFGPGVCRVFVPKSVLSVVPSKFHSVCHFSSASVMWCVR